MDTKKRFKGLAALAVLIGVIALMKFLPFQEWLKPFFSGLEDMGALGMICFVGIGVILTLLFVPVSVPITLAGFFFGVGSGFLMSMAIVAASTSISGLAGKWLWPKVEHLELFQQSTFQAVRKVLKEEGLWMVALLRITPFLHFMTGNLFLGSLDLKFFPYLGYSLLGMIPGTLMIVALGDVANKSMFQDSGLSFWKIGLFAVGVVAFGIASWQITRKTRKKLDQES